MPRKASRKRRRSSRDPLQVQIAVRGRLPRGRRLTKTFLRDAIRHKAATGEDLPGLDINIVRWRNPGRKNTSLRDWRTGDQADAWATLRRPLQRITVGAFSIRRRQRGR